jgi:hypothetical protein
MHTENTTSFFKRCAPMFNESPSALELLAA